MLVRKLRAIIGRGLATGRVSSSVGAQYLVRETGIGVLLGCLTGRCSVRTR